MSVWALIRSGGWVMWPLLICSLVVWAVCIERFLALRHWRERNREFLLSFSNFWLRGDRDSAQKLCDASNTDLAEIAAELVKHPSEQRKPLNNDQLISRVERRRLEQSSNLRRFLWLLGTIGSSAPFIGLFGTVVGIIKAFQAMAVTGSGGFAVVAAGISEALVATAAGIFVAVIAVFFYNYFQIRVSRIQFQLKLLAEEMLEVSLASEEKTV